MNDHIKSFHEQTKDFECTHPGCSDKFSRKSVLVVHMRKHTNDKPYTCDICNKRFTESGNLKIHKKTHDEVRFFRL